jgi:segregation and condensation protein A
MDPWDIDVALLARRYREHLQALRELRFELPGRMVLACSILLRVKSDDLLARARPARDGDLLGALEDALDDDEELWQEPVAPEEFSLPLLRRPTRNVTLEDLRRAFAAAMIVSSRRQQRAQAVDLVDDEDYDPFAQFEIGGTDFTDRLHSLFSKIKQLLSGRTVLSFFKLLDRGGTEERVERFFEVLHLASQGQIDCRQKEFLGDIEITLTSP